jgi:hypothetical protein
VYFNIHSSSFTFPVNTIDKKRIYFEEPKKEILKGTAMVFDGVPFMIKSSVRMECQHGKDQHASDKRKYSSENRSPVGLFESSYRLMQT